MRGKKPLREPKRFAHARLSVLRTGISRHLSTLLCGLLFATGIQADAGPLEEILVTATRRSESIQDIPYNISTMSGEQLEAANVSGLADLASTIPGIAYADLGVRSAGVNSQLILRGLNANAQGSIGAYINNLTPAGVSTYMDNTPLFVNLKLYDLDRVEVLRGPQGTLYGAGSVGGTVRFIFNKPDPARFDTDMTVGISSTEDADEPNYIVDGMVNMPLGESAALRISAGFEQHAGFVDGRRLAVGGFEAPRLADPADPFGTPLATEYEEDINDADQWYLRASLLWNLRSNLQAYLTYQHQEDSADGFSAQTAPGLTGAKERAIDQYFTSPLDRQVDLFSLELDIDLGFASLESSTSYTINEDHNRGDLSGLAMVNDIFAGGFAFGGYPATNGRLGSYYDGATNVKSFAQEFRLISNGDGRLDWVVGLYYQDIDSDFSEDIAIPSFADYANTPGHPFTAFLPVPPFLSWANLVAGPPGFVSQDAIEAELFFTYIRPQKIEDFAVFGEVSHHLTDQWQVTLGARVFWNENKSSLTSTFPLFGAVASADGMDPSGFNFAEGADDVQDEIFKINTSYDFSDDLMVYLTWAEGFRRGGANAFPLTGFNAEDSSLLTFRPDRVTNYEVGVKGNLSNRLTYTAALFRIDWEDPQLAGTFLPSGFQAVVNAEEARTQGIELEGRLQVTEQLSITAGYSYTDAEFTSDFATPLGPSDLVPDFQGGDGSPLPGVPESIATWAIDYAHPVGNLGASTVHFRIDGYYRSSVVTASSSQSPQFERLDGFDLWNASITWANDHWRVGVFARNITDEVGITAVLRDFSIASPTESLDMIMQPRTIGVTVRYDY
jgi:outer membrane receptor protein involved in Fe transport